MRRPWASGRGRSMTTPYCARGVCATAGRRGKCGGGPRCRAPPPGTKRWARSSPDAADELRDFALEGVGGGRQLAAHVQDLGRALAGASGGGRHLGDALRHLGGAGCRLLSVARDLLGGRALLLHRRSEEHTSELQSLMRI